MRDFDELDKRSTSELHHRAVQAAEHHLDITFFWRLLEYIPMAELIAGSEDEALRPVYIDYLAHHPEPGEG
jgi:hypothetical protein